MLKALSCHALSILLESHHCGSALLVSCPGVPITWTKINWLGLKFVYTRLIGLVSLQGASCLTSHLVQTPAWWATDAALQPPF